MNKILVSLIVLFVLIVAGSYFYQASKAVPIVAETSIKKDTPPAPETSILLYPESGDVTFKPTPNDEFRTATASPTVIPNKSIVRTNIGKASILLPDNSSISLDNNTEITVNYGEKDISIYQTLGTTYHRVQALLTGNTYQVQTAGTLAAVRGTKFAVKYDVKTKKTKLAVTENKVEVSTIPKGVGTSTAPAPVVAMIEEGKMVSVPDDMSIVSGSKGTMQIVPTQSDTEMKGYIEIEKKRDVLMDAMKKETPNMEEFRIEMKRVLGDVEGTQPKTILEIRKTESEEVIEKPVSEVKPTIKRENTVAREEAPPQRIAPAIVPVTNNVVVNKMDEEKFFNEFEPLFIRHFYLDETDSACNEKVTPEIRVSIVTSFATKAGYPFTKTTLLSYAKAIDAYCSRKDDETKAKLQSRFDAEYPFGDEI